MLVWLEPPVPPVVVLPSAVSLPDVEPPQLARAIISVARVVAREARRFVVIELGYQMTRVKSHDSSCYWPEFLTEERRATNLPRRSSGSGCREAFRRGGRSRSPPAPLSLLVVGACRLARSLLISLLRGGRGGRFRDNGSGEPCRGSGATLIRRSSGFCGDLADTGRRSLAGRVLIAHADHRRKLKPPVL